MTSSRQNGDNIIRLGQVSRPQAQMLARYAPEYPCLLGGLVNAGKREAQAFRGFTLHIVLETLPQPAAWLHRRRPARCTPTTAARTASTCRTRRGTRATRCGTSRTSTTASTPRPARAPTASRRRYADAAAAGTPAARPRRASSRPARTVPRARPRPGARPRRPAGRPDGAGSGGVVAMSIPLLRTATRTRTALAWPSSRLASTPRRRPCQAAGLHGRHRTGDQRARDHHRQHQLRLDEDATGPSSSTRPVWSRATTSGSPASRSASVKGISIVDRTRRW